MRGTQSKDALEPLAMMILSSLTPKDIEVEFFDERIEKLPKALDSDAICLSVETFSAKRAYILAAHYKKQNPGTKIIMGGFHITGCPEEASLYADSIILGDAEPVWAQVMSDLKSHTLQPKYAAEHSFMLPYSQMDKNIFRGKKYTNVGIVQWKRGCVFNCNFCSIHAFYHSKILERAVDDVIEEIRNMKQKLIFIADDNLLYNRDKLKEFLIKLAPLKKKWCCQVSINVTNDDEILSLMAKSGCIIMLIGFESLNIKNLKEIGKVQNVANKDYDKAIEKIYKHKIMIYATFIFGYSHDTLESFDEVYEFAMKHKFVIANFNPLMAMPATDLYAELKEKKELINETWWLSDDFAYGDAMHYPKNFSPEELTTNCKRLRYRFYSLKSIFKRLLSGLNFRHFGIFMLINLVSGFEIKQKQNAGLGGESL
jgi:radical SAM superfamily enzyme YgiQ (UPF0313 family)